MTDREAFLKKIIDYPEDDTPRLVYADWLDEHGETERAEFIRVQCKLASLRPTYQVVVYGYNPDDRRVFRDESIDVVSTQVQHYRIQHPGHSSQTGVECIPHELEIDLRKRERELLLWEAAWANDDSPSFSHLYDLARLRGLPRSPHKWQRGFVETVSCPWADWEVHHAAILAQTPLKNVELTTRPEIGVEILPRGFSKPQFVIAGKTIDVPWHLFNAASGNADFDWPAAALSIRWPRQKFTLPPPPQFGVSPLATAFDGYHYMTEMQIAIGARFTTAAN